MKTTLLTAFLCMCAVHCVSCEEIVRLTSITSDQDSVTGNVEIYMNGEWEPLCGRLWGLQDANVVCKTIGFKKGAKGNPRHPISSGESKQKHWFYVFDGLACLGTEASVTECPNWSKHISGIRNCAVGRAAAQCIR